MSQDSLHASNVHCIWMDAGVVGFKLCDRDLQCEQCPFDEILRRPPVEVDDENDARSPSRGKRSPAPSDAVERTLHSIFSSIDLSVFPDDRLYHRGHTWMQRIDDSTVTLGLDHVAGSILGSIASIVLPQAESRLVQKAPWCWLVHHEGALSLFSPIHGTVLETNGNLLEHPEHVMLDPYRRGWIIRARCGVTRPPDNGFVDRKEYWPYVQTELRDLRGRFAQHAKKAPPIGQTMMDGGRAVESLCTMTGPVAFIAIVSSMFGP